MIITTAKYLAPQLLSVFQEYPRIDVSFKVISLGSVAKRSKCGTQTILQNSLASRKGITRKRIVGEPFEFGLKVRVEENVMGQSRSSRVFRLKEAIIEKLDWMYMFSIPRKN